MHQLAQPGILQPLESVLVHPWIDRRILRGREDDLIRPIHLPMASYDWGNPVNRTSVVLVFDPLRTQIIALLNVFWRVCLASSPLDCRFVSFRTFFECRPGYIEAGKMDDLSVFSIKMRRLHRVAVAAYHIESFGENGAFHISEQIFPGLQVASLRQIQIGGHTQD